MNKEIELAICIAGIYACFISWGVLQERVSTTPYASTESPTSSGSPTTTTTNYFTHFVFLNLVQSACASLIGFVYVRVICGGSLISAAADADKSKLFRMYLLVALLGSIASPFGYASLQHVDYLTMMLAKSCKLLPVMAMSFLLHRQRFAWFKYVGVGLITAGVALFMLWSGGSKATKDQRQSSAWGLLLLSTNLIIDGATNSTQDNLFRQYRVSGPQMMFFMNALSAVLMVVYLGLFNPLVNAYTTDGSLHVPFLNFEIILPVEADGLVEAISFCTSHPSAMYDILMFGICGAVGQVFIFHTLQQFGSLILVTVNVTRKMMSMVVSVVWFGHRLTAGQWFGVALVFFGIGLEAQMSRQLAAKKSAEMMKNKTNEIVKDVDGDEIVQISATTTAVNIQKPVKRRTQK